MVHGDDFVAVGPNQHFEHIEKTLGDKHKYKIKVEKLGLGKGQGQGGVGAGVRARKRLCGSGGRSGGDGRMGE